MTLAPATQILVKHILRWGTIFYGGNFAVRREALAQVGGFDTSIEFDGEDANLGRRLLAIGKVKLVRNRYVHISARRYRATGKRAVFRLYVRNFTSESRGERPEVLELFRQRDPQPAEIERFHEVLVETRL